MVMMAVTPLGDVTSGDDGGGSNNSSGSLRPCPVWCKKYNEKNENDYFIRTSYYKKQQHGIYGSQYGECLQLHTALLFDVKLSRFQAAWKDIRRHIPDDPSSGQCEQ